MSAAPMDGDPIEVTRSGESDRESLVGMTSGVGFGSFIFGGQMKHDIAFVNVYYGRTFSEPMGDGFLQGRWYLLGELSVGREIHPGNAWVASLTPVVQYRFESSDILVPFVEVGYGISWTDLGEPDLGGDYQFNGYLGGGFAWHLRPNLAWVVQYRFIHYSNAGLRKPNSGVNLHSALTGVSYFF